MSYEGCELHQPFEAWLLIAGSLKIQHGCAFDVPGAWTSTWLLAMCIGVVGVNPEASRFPRPENPAFLA